MITQPQAGNRMPQPIQPPIRPLLLIAMFVALGAAALTAITKGPDAGGYSGTDATTFSFVDIAGASGGIGLMAGVDDGLSVLTLPFPFTFYGQSHSLLCVSSNGALYFVASEAACGGFTDFANTDLTTVAPPNDYPAILPLWTDLTFQTAGAGAVFYQTLGSAPTRKFIVQWNDAFPQGSPAPVTFQAILTEGTNTILFQYKTVSLGAGNPASDGAQATIGVRNAGALDTHQQVAWSFGAPVVADNTAVLFAPATETTLVDGRMFGAGHVEAGGQHHHFVFRVQQRGDSEAGRLEYWVEDARRCSPADHAYDRDRGANGSRDEDYDRGNRRTPPQRFRATSVSEVVFSNDAAFASGSSGPRPTADAVAFTGTGQWNGRPGYTFEAQAGDRGEPGRGRDTFAVTIKDAAGAIVATINGTLAGGNIQSMRVKR